MVDLDKVLVTILDVHELLPCRAEELVRKVKETHRKLRLTRWISAKVGVLQGGTGVSFCLVFEVGGGGLEGSLNSALGSLRCCGVVAAAVRSEVSAAVEAAEIRVKSVKKRAQTTSTSTSHLLSLSLSPLLSLSLSLLHTSLSTTTRLIEIEAEPFATSSLTFSHPTPPAPLICLVLVARDSADIAQRQWKS